MGEGAAAGLASGSWIGVFAEVASFELIGNLTANFVKQQGIERSTFWGRVGFLVSEGEGAFEWAEFGALPARAASRAGAADVVSFHVLVEDVHRDVRRDAQQQKSALRKRTEILVSLSK